MIAYDLSDVTVLVVEPNSLMREILREALSGLGITRLAMVPSPDEALAMLRNPDGIDMVLTEIEFDGRDGLHFIQKIRQLPSQEASMLPIIVVAADTLVERITGARDMGGNEFLAKPVAAISLYRRIVQVIERPRPFVRIKDGYFGPDRRRQIKEFSGSERRADALPEPVAGNPRD